MRLIDADALAAMCDAPHWCVWLNEIDGAPTVDAVPVVRCKDCKHCDFFHPVKEIDKESIPVWYCKAQRGNRMPDDFCSCGERRDND